MPHGSSAHALGRSPTPNWLFLLQLRLHRNSVGLLPHFVFWRCTAASAYSVTMRVARTSWCTDCLQLWTPCTIAAHWPVRLWVPRGQSLLVLPSGTKTVLSCSVVYGFFATSAATVALLKCIDIVFLHICRLRRKSPIATQMSIYTVTVLLYAYRH